MTHESVGPLQAGQTDKEVAMRNESVFGFGKLSGKRQACQLTACLALATFFLLASSGCSTWKMPKMSMPLLGGNNDFQDDDVDVFDPLQRRVSDRITLQDLAPANFATTLKAKTVNKIDRQRAEQEFNTGRQLYTDALQAKESGSAEYKDKFSEAANHFRLASAYAPDSTIDQDALYYQGESYFFADCYPQANRAFELLLARFAGTTYLDKVEARRLAIAQYWLQLADKQSPWQMGIKLGDPQRPSSGLTTEARRILHQIRLDDPTGRLADDATMALANSYFLAARYTEAAETYEDLRTSYPSSKHQFEAHLFELKSRLMSYYGESYDGEPLEKADKLLKAMVTQFPSEAQEHREYLGNEAARVRDLMAQRDWKMAEYYERRGENRAAQVYYQQVVNNFQDTSLASEANQKIAALAELPPEPGEFAPFLQKMFPDIDESKPLVAAGDKESILR